MAMDTKKNPTILIFFSKKMSQNSRCITTQHILGSFWGDVVLIANTVKQKLWRWLKVFMMESLFHWMSYRRTVMCHFKRGFYTGFSWYLPSQSTLVYPQALSCAIKSMKPNTIHIYWFDNKTSTRPHHPVNMILPSIIRYFIKWCQVARTNNYH